MSYTHFCRDAYEKERKLLLKMEELKKTALSMQHTIVEKDKLIMELQTRLRYYVLTNHADLDPCDLELSDPLFQEAEAAQLYELKPEQLVNLLLKKEQCIQQMFQQYAKLKKDRDRLSKSFTVTKTKRDPLTNPGSSMNATLTPTSSSSSSPPSCFNSTPKFTEKELLSLIRLWSQKEKEYLKEIQVLKKMLQGKK